MTASLSIMSAVNRLRSPGARSAFGSPEDILAHAASISDPFGKRLERIATGRFGFSDIRSISKIYPIIGDHDLYQRHIETLAGRRLFPELQSRKFVGTGFGASSLNAYRLVTLSGEQAPVIEKVYDARSAEAMRVQWFYSNGRAHLGSGARVPALERLVRSDRVLIVYFETLDFRPATPDELLSIHARLWRGLKPVEDPTIPGASIRDFRLTYPYKVGFRELRRRTDSADAKDALYRAEAGLLQGTLGRRRIFAHYDMTPDNVSSDGALIDLDRCGIYPDGLDAAFILARNFGALSHAEAMERLKQEGIILQPSEMPGFLFLYAVFLACRVHEKKVAPHHLDVAVREFCLAMGVAPPRS